MNKINFVINKSAAFHQITRRQMFERCRRAERVQARAFVARYLREDFHPSFTLNRIAELFGVTHSCILHQIKMSHNPDEDVTYKKFVETLQ